LFLPDGNVIGVHGSHNIQETSHHNEFGPVVGIGGADGGAAPLKDPRQKIERASAQVAPVKKSTAVTVNNNESRLI